MGVAPRTTALAVSLCFAAAAPRPAAAVDGVIEINQARALAGGVTASDTPGFPVTIDSSGGYRLTGNLTVDQNTNAIRVTVAAKEVTIDLNGYSILGPVTCTIPSPVNCSPSGTGVGVLGNGITALRVVNGSIRGMGQDGINATGILKVESVHVTYSHGNGISGGWGSVVTDSVADSNGGYGISVGTASLVRGCFVSYNGLIGIDAGPRALIINNTVTENGSTVAGPGIGCQFFCSITGNTVTYNGLYGIYVLDGSSVLDNAISHNALQGLDMVGPGGYARNVLTNNNGGDGNQQVLGGANAIQIGTNICGTDTVCP